MNFLEGAATLGQRLVDQALWDGPSCTWNITVAEGTAETSRPPREPAGGALYQGTSGIAWFLAELSRRTSDEDSARTAAGALHHALAYGGNLHPANFGFHSGRVGIAYVAARLADLLERPALRDQAWKLLQPLAGQEHHDHGIDLIAGAAGAIPALLELHTSLARDELFAMARALGDRLLALAHREPGGWSWRTVQGSAVRNLNGLAHGSSGIGLALLELATATGEGKYLFAAEMAFLYERQFWNPQVGNWPDWRNQEIGTFTYSGRIDELRRQARAGKVPGYHLHYMTAWCHGSPGIGLARLRAFELTGQNLYREEATAALPGTLRSIEQGEFSFGNYSLCHGIAGNCEFPFLASTLLGDPTLREVCEQALTRGWETCEQAARPWPSGTTSGGPDPSLLLGEAGIGFFFLRLAAQHSGDPMLQTPLLLRPQYQSAPRTTLSAGYEELARHTVEESFGTTLRACHLLGLDFCAPPAPRPGEVPLARTPAAATFEALCQTVENLDELRRSVFDDAFLVERRVYELTLVLEDFTTEFLHDLTRPGWEEVDPTVGRFQRALGGQRVTTRWDWQAILASQDAAPTHRLADLAPPAETEFLLYRKGNRIHHQRLGPFAALLLDAVEYPVTLAQIAEQVAAALDAADLDHAILVAKILPQLEELHRAGFINHSP